MDLAASVLDYYFTHVDRLSSEKRFHLACRMTAWNGDPRAKELLDMLRAEFVPSPADDTSLGATLEDAAQRAVNARHEIVSYDLRKSHFEKYSQLLALDAELFRVRHLRTVYGVDAMAALLKRHPLSSLRQLEQDLLADSAAMRSLSTWAINYIYLLHRIILGEDDGIDVQSLYNLGDGYDLEDEEQLRLLIYMYTHCIIAESNFYARPLPEANLQIYRDMLVRLETLLEGRLGQTSLDTKLEFLVCCRLVGYETRLATSIHQECAESLSPEGTFIVDTHNVFQKHHEKKSFEASEHRNVLFVMGVLPRFESQTAKL